MHKFNFNSVKLKYYFKGVIKRLRFGIVSAAGRNFQGIITVRHRSGGDKMSQHFIDFFRRINSRGIVFKFLKVRSFTGYLGLILYFNGLCTYCLLGDKSLQHDIIYNGSIIEDIKQNVLVDGNSIPLLYIPLFSIVSNVELYPYQGGKFFRAAGSGAILSSKMLDIVSLKLRSG